MFTNAQNKENVVFITETCCAVRDHVVIVNNGSEQRKVPALLWRLLDCLISAPNQIVPFPEIYDAVWNKQHEPSDVSQALGRFKGVCKGIGVEVDAINMAFDFISNEGVRFNPPSHHIDYTVLNPSEQSMKRTSIPPQEDAYFITGTCYFHRKERVLINNGIVSKPLSGLVWNFLQYFLRHPGVLVSYEAISVAVWGDKHHKASKYTSQLLHRLKDEYLQPIGVDEIPITQAFVTTPKGGVTFHPARPVDIDLNDIGEALRNTGIPQNDLLEIIDCMLYRGISGRMGREAITALAKKHNTMACLELGELAYHGYISHNHKPDYRMACEYYSQAGKHPTALWTLGYCIMNNYYPVVEQDKIDYLKARDYFEQAILITTKTGESAPAYTSLGQLWEEGHYPEDDFASTHKCKPQDIKQALYYYKKAADMGYHYAANRMGRYYERKAFANPTIKENPKCAFEWFEKSVSYIADGYALNKLGQYYETGFGCEVNPDKACECYMRGVDEVLEDDITGWNFFNAGRVCANRVKNQPKWHCNLPRAFDLFNEALQKLPIRDHGKVLIEMMEILSFDKISELSSAVIKRKKYEVQYRVNLFLDEVEKGEISPDEEIVAKVKLLVENL